MSSFAQISALLFCASVCAFLVWLNHHDGHAMLRPPVQFDRQRNPVGYWIIQALFASIALAMLVGAFAIALGYDVLKG